VSSEGRELYEQICQACHMADARGGGQAGAMIPALAGNPRLADKDYPSIILLKGRGGMPWFTDMLTRPQIAAVLNYVRGHFNDYHDEVTVADLDRISTANPPVPDCNCGH
jgi:mono/diheme cytochrome c family protein